MPRLRRTLSHGKPSPSSRRPAPPCPAWRTLRPHRHHAGTPRAQRARMRRTGGPQLAAAPQAEGCPRAERREPAAARRLADLPQCDVAELGAPGFMTGPRGLVRCGLAAGSREGACPGRPHHPARAGPAACRQPFAAAVCYLLAFGMTT